ncbi:hypothetical protein [Clostridium perfringens]|nr:hypothetical protein [Clostridium perfringens]
MWIIISSFKTIRECYAGPWPTKKFWVANYMTAFTEANMELTSSTQY